MSTKRRSSDKTGHTGCRRGAPSLRTVARKASPTLNWNSNERPVSAKSGSAAANSFQVTMDHLTPTPGSAAAEGRRRDAEVRRPPVIFNIRCAFGRQALAKPDRNKTLLLIERTGGVVLLMCMKFQPTRR